MRRWLARLDWGALTVALLCLLAVWPWLMRPGLPAATDAEIHVPRVAEFARILADGVLYPRWAPDFYLGYGYPLFNFYAPLTYYLAQPFYLLTSAAGAAEALFVLATFLGGLGAYAFARRGLGRAAGVVAAGAFVFSPYLVLIDPFVRVDLAEFLAIAWTPWVLWGFDRLLAGEARAGVVVAALPLAALALTHNLMLVLFAPLLTAFLLFRLFSAGDRETWLRVAAAGALAVGLSAVFWLPALIEKQYIVLDQVIGRDDFDFHRHFVTLGELLRPSPRIDQGALNPPLAYNLGLAQWALAGLGWLAVHFLPQSAQRSPRQGIEKQNRSSHQGEAGWTNCQFVRRICLRVLRGSKRHAAPPAVKLSNFMGVAALVLGFLMLEASAPVWEAVPLLRYVQFPWRLLGVVALPLAWLAGAGVSAFGKRWQPWMGVAALTLLLIGALPALYPPPWEPLQADFSPYEMIARLELDGVALGTTANREYTPIWVTVPPHESAQVLAGYEAGGPVDRFEREGLPPGAEVRMVRSTSVADLFEVSSPEPFRAVVRRFYFPGWRARLDGAPLEIAPSEPHGFIAASLPAGTHELELRFGATPPRTLGSVVSLASLLVLAGMVLRERDRRGSPGGAMDRSRLLPLAVVVLLFFTAKVAVVDRQSGWFRLDSTGDEVAVAQHHLVTQFEGQVALLGYDLPQTAVAQDGALRLTLYWRAIGSVPENYSVFAHLVRPSEHTWGQDDRLNPGDVPTTRWPVDGRYVRDVHRLAVLPGTPPGVYRLEVGLYELGTGRRLFVLDESGAPVSQGVILPQTVEVVRVEEPPPVGEGQMLARVDATFGGAITLLGYDLNPAGTLWPPNFAHVTLFWRAEQDSLPDLSVAVRLRDEAGRIRAQVGGRPVDGHYPTVDWQAGEVVRDQHSFWLAGDADPGRYAVEVAVTDAQSGESLPPTGDAAQEADWMLLTAIEVRRP